MENIKVQSQVIPNNQPSFEEWKKEFKVSSTHNCFNKTNKERSKKLLINKFLDQNFSL